MSLISELNRRNVLRVAAAYALIAWILIEAGSVLLPTFGAPDWVFKTYVLLVFAGFIGALIFAWVYELTPEGIRLDSQVDRTASKPKPRGRKMDFVIIALLGVALAISLTLNIAGLRNAGFPQAVAGDISIAVLPFENRSLEPGNALFADGIHDDLLTSLANIDSLKVISRTSVLEYRDTAKNLRQIGSELGVTTVLEGSVQRVGDSVRINVQLIDAATDEHLWAKIYDRELTAGNIFAIQSEIAAEITGALKAELTEEEQVRMAAVPTESLEAYRLYTEGRDNVYKRRLETLLIAREQFERAIELDPNYSQAYSGLADSVMLLQINHNALTPGEAHDIAEQALDKALELDKTNADAYASLGLLKMSQHVKEKGVGHKEAEEAEKAFEKALKLNPNHATAYMWFASLRNAEFRYQESIDLYEKSLDVDPLGRVSRMNLAGVYAQLGDYEEATRQWRELIRLYPGWPMPYNTLATHLAGLGRFDESLAWAVKARELSTDPLAGQAALAVFLEIGDSEMASEALDELPASHPLFPIAMGYQRTFERDYAGAIFSWEQAMTTTGEPYEFVYGSLSDSALVIEDYEKSLEYCLKKHPEFAGGSTPDINPGNVKSAVMYAFLLQQSGETNRAARWLDAALAAVNEMPRVGMSGHGILDVQILALQGKTAAALTAFRQAYAAGFRGSRVFGTWALEDDPYLVSLRDQPEYQAVVADIARDVHAMRQRIVEAEETGDWQALRSLAINRARSRLLSSDP